MSCEGRRTKEGAGKTNGQEGAELYDGFQRHGENETVLVFRRVGVARAEKNGEHGQDGRDRQRDVAEEKHRWSDRRAVMFHDKADASGNGLELERDIGNRTDGGDAGRK